MSGRRPAVSTSQQNFTRQRTWISSLLGVLLTLWGSRVLAANPYLVAQDEKPVTAAFQGAEWGDDITEKELPLRAQVVTTRLAQLAWGAVFKIEFTAVVSTAPKPRSLAPRYFLATDSQIALLNVEDLAAAIAQLKTLSKAPELAPEDIYGISQGKRTYQTSQNASATLEVTGSRCVYKWSHTSGHFTTVVWKRGQGLVEYSQGRGARADGYRLLRQGSGSGAQHL